MMKKTIAILLALMMIMTAVPFTGAFAAEDQGAPSDYAVNAALYVHAVCNSADTEAWQEWQSVHDEISTSKIPTKSTSSSPLLPLKT